MKKLVLNPDSWECTLEECPPGLFVFEGMVCFKTEYPTDSGKVQAFNKAGEMFCYEGTILVQPVLAKWEDDEE